VCVQESTGSADSVKSTPETLAGYGDEPPVYVVDCLLKEGHDLVVKDSCGKYVQLTVARLYAVHGVIV